MLEQSILKTLTFFDLSDQPLTVLEIWKYLIKSDQNLLASLAQVHEALIQMQLQNKVEQENGFYFLPGRNGLVQRRMKMYPLYMTRINRAARAVKVLRYVPYVRGIAVGGSLAQMRSKEDSDIDFFVITKPGRVWLARLLLSGVAQILGVRRYGYKISNRICLNHYSVSGFTLKEDHTLYAAIEYASLLPLFSPQAFTQFYSKQNWIDQFLVNPPTSGQLSVLRARESRMVQPFLTAILEVLGAAWWERIARHFQIKRIQPQEGIIMTDNEISLHPDPKGVAFMRKYNKKISSE